MVDHMRFDRPRLSTATASATRRDCGRARNLAAGCTVTGRWWWVAGSHGRVRAFRSDGRSVLCMRLLERASCLAASVVAMLIATACSPYRQIEQTFAHLPEPISLRDFLEAERRYGELDEARWLEIEALHEAYLEQYGLWRARTADALAAALRRRSWEEIEDDPQALLVLERRASGGMADLAGLDEAMFAEVQAVVDGSPWQADGGGDPDEALRLLRARRAMARWLAVIEGGGGRPRDLRRWLESQHWLEQFEFDSSDAAAVAYEEASRPILERLARAEWSLPRRIAEIRAIDEAVEDPESEPRNVEARIAEAREPVAQALQDLLALQEETVRRIAGGLPPTLGVVLEARFLEDTVGGGEVAGDLDALVARMANAIVDESTSPEAIFSSQSQPDPSSSQSEDGAAAMGLLLVLAADPADRVSAREREILLGEGLAIYRQRASILQRTLDAQRAASRPGALAGGSSSDRVRNEVRAPGDSAAAALGMEMAGFIERTFEPERLAELFGATRQALRSTRPAASKPAAQAEGLAGLAASELDRFDRSIDVPPSSPNAEGLRDEDGWRWIAERLSERCTLDQDAQAVLEQLFEADILARRTLVEAVEQRLQEAVAPALEELKAIESQIEAAREAEGGPPRLLPEQAQAVRAVIARHRRPAFAAFERMLAEVEAFDLEAIERLSDALPQPSLGSALPLLRLAVAERLGQALSGEVIDQRDVLGGARISTALLLLALPLTPEELADLAPLVSEAEGSIRAAIVAQRRAALEFAAGMIERELLKTVWSEPKWPRREIAAVLVAAEGVQHAQGELLRAAEQRFPEAAPMLREAELEAMWPGVWDSDRELEKMLASLCRGDARVAAWGEGRSRFAETASASLAGRVRPTPSPFAGAGTSSSATALRLRVDPALHAASVAHRENLFRTARRVSRLLASEDAARGDLVLESALAHPVGNLDGNRLWE